MKKVLKIINLIIIVTCFFLTSTIIIKSPAFAQEAECQGVTVTKKFVGNPATVTADKILLPIDTEVQIHVPKTANGINSQLVYGLYAVSGSDVGWIYDQTTLLQAEDHSTEIVFKIKKTTTEMHIQKLLGATSNYKLIPTPNNFWGEDRNINFRVIGKFAPLTEESLPAACAFSLKLTNKCSALGKFQFEQKVDPDPANTYFKISFSADSLIPQGVNDNFSFARRQGIDPALSNEIKIDPNSEAQNKSFRLSKNRSSVYFGQSTNLNLHYKNGADDSWLCETPFMPTDLDFDDQLKNCSVSPVNDASAPPPTPSQFRGQFMAKSVPTKMLDNFQISWVNTGAAAQPRLVVMPFSVFEQIQTQGTSIDGIRSTTDAYNQLFCDPDTVNKTCFNITAPGPEIRQVSQLTDGKYITIISYIVSSIYSRPEDTAYYLLPTCSTVFKYENGLIDLLSPIPPFPTGAPGETVVPTMNLSLIQICDNVTPADKKGECIKCIDVDKGVWTALGCISTDIGGFVASFFRIGLGIAGGVAFLFLIFGGFTVLTSAGNPETIQQGKDTITSAITGLLLIIFSIFLLQLISVDILKIPGFSKDTSTVTTPACRNLCADGKTCCKITETCDEPIPGRFSCKAPCPAGSTLCDTSTNPPLCCSSGQTCTKLPVPHCQ